MSRLVFLLVFAGLLACSGCLEYKPFYGEKRSKPPVPTPIKLSAVGHEVAVLGGSNGGNAFRSSKELGKPKLAYSNLLPGYHSIGHPLVADETLVFIVCHESEKPKLFGVSADEGKFLWERNFYMNCLATVGVAISHGVALVTDGPSLVAVSLKDGKPVWIARGMGTFFPRVQGDIAVCHGRKRLAAVDISNGQTRWEKETMGGSPVLLVDGNKIIVCGEKEVLCLSLAKGEKLWSFDKSTFKHSCHPMAYVDDVIVMRYSDGGFFFLNKDTGKLARPLQPRRHAHMRAEALLGKNLFGSTSRGEVFKFSLATFKKVWRKKGVKAVGPHTVALNNQLVTQMPIKSAQKRESMSRLPNRYLRSNYRRILYGLDSETAAILWQERLPGDSLTLPYFYKGSLYVTCCSAKNNGVYYLRFDF